MISATPCTLSKQQMEDLFNDNNCCDTDCTVGVDTCTAAPQGGVSVSGDVVNVASCTGSQTDPLIVKSTMKFPSGTNFSIDENRQITPTVPGEYRQVYVTRHPSGQVEVNYFPEVVSGRRLAGKKVVIACYCDPGQDGQWGVCNPFVYESDTSGISASAGCLSPSCTNCNSQVWILKSEGNIYGNTTGYFQKLSAPVWQQSQVILGLQGYTPILSIQEWNALSFASGEQIRQAALVADNSTNSTILVAFKTPSNTKLMVRTTERHLVRNQIFVIGVNNWRCTGCTDCTKLVDGPIVTCEGCALQTGAGCLLTNAATYKSTISSDNTATNMTMTKLMTVPDGVDVSLSGKKLQLQTRASDMTFFTEDIQTASGPGDYDVTCDCESPLNGGNDDGLGWCKPAHIGSWVGCVSQGCAVCKSKVSIPKSTISDSDSVIFARKGAARYASSDPDTVERPISSMIEWNSLPYVTSLGARSDQVNATDLLQHSDKYVHVAYRLMGRKFSK